MFERIDCQEGDRVLFTKYSGTETRSLNGEGDEHVILREDEILAVIA